MHDFLPWMFIIAASAGMVAWLCSLWLSLSLALSNEVSSSAGSQLNSADRRTLLNEKEALLHEIRDVDRSDDVEENVLSVQQAELTAIARSELVHRELGLGDGGCHLTPP